jgi:hypothetical protein
VLHGAGCEWCVRMRGADVSDVEYLMTEEEAAEAGYREWVGRYLWHVDQLPRVVEAAGTIVMASRGLRAAPLTERLTGGGYVDNIPVTDGPESRNARAVWDALRAYLTVCSSRIGVEAPLLPAALPEDVDAARMWAYRASEWLAAAVESILDWPDLSELENTLFRLIRRARTRLDTGTVRRGRSEPCGVCGQDGVVVDWADGADGSAVLVKTCRVCGEVYAS